ncbi:MAG TPA: three-Cys-motif partner protein TcmP [Ignavibacteria bacterium]|nr:three-Cys-motif partner protein TcmP [Ignavibacteria bacterium]HMR41726.1 three-Cys-motif partner protein TcmP [Ignavibacteria bacterium]
MVNKKDPKKYILPHSEAKLEFYESYLKRYLRIILLSEHITTISIFDLFCGTGIYEDGKSGSPILAFNIIQNILAEYPKYKNTKTINLIVNDGESKNIEKVKSKLDTLNTSKVCNIYYKSYGSDEIFKRVNNYLKKNNDSRARNLIFIDPYGYKEIHKNDIEKLLSNGHTEIILFLPLSHMHRFKGVAFSDKINPSYTKLRNFIIEFFPNDHPLIKGQFTDIYKFINYLKDAFSFNNKFFTASFYIQRDKANFNVLFFISPNIYGMEKILEVKWQLDRNTGRGYSIGQDDLNLQQLLPGFQLNQFEKNLENYLKGNTNTSNLDLYLFTIKNEHLPKHTNEILKKWQNEKTLLVLDVEKNKDARKNSFYINFDYYKNNKIKVSFKKI